MIPRKKLGNRNYLFEQHHDVMENELYYGQWFASKGKVVKLICDNVKKKKAEHVDDEPSIFFLYFFSLFCHLWSAWHSPKLED